jgi:TonB family protein
MSSSPADTPALPPQGNDWLPGPTPPSEGWSRRKFYSVLGFVLAFHLALIFLFGTKKQIVPRAAINVPHLQMIDNSGELIALRDPTLFARPNPHDLVTLFWRHLPAIPQPEFNWTEPPRYLRPDIASFGADFAEFMRESRAAELPLDFKPAPRLPQPASAPMTPMPAETTWQISGALAQLQLLTTNQLKSLPSLPRNDVLAPTSVQALVDVHGNVFSAVVLQSSGDPDADRLAVQLVSNLRFAPATQLTFGQLTFTWRTVPRLNRNDDHAAP